MTARGGWRAGRRSVVLHLFAFAGGALVAHFVRPAAPACETGPHAAGAAPAVRAAPPVREQAELVSAARGAAHGAATEVAPAVPTRSLFADEPAPSDDERSLAREANELPASTADALGRAYRDGMIITGSTPHRLILFTFDDGPDTRTTPLLLDRLDEAGIKAVFFLVASRIAGTTPIERHQAALAREIARRGHLIGGHTLDHVQLPLLDDAAVEHQLSETDRIFKQVLGGAPVLFRPPFGAHSQRVDQHLAAHHYTPVLWNLGAGDFQVRSTDEVFDLWLKVFERRARENGDRGGVVLLHDTYEWSVDAFERIVAYLQQQNCELLERGEELYDIVDDPSFFYVPRADAPAETEAPPAEPPAAVLAARQALLRERTARRCKSLASAY